MAYGFDMFGWYIGVVPDGTRRLSTTVAPTNTSLLQSEGVNRSNWNGAAWADIPYKYQDPPALIEYESKGLNPIAFKMLFVTKERIAIYAAKSSNETIADFISILDDQRTIEVRLDVQTTIEGVTYCINAIKADPNVNYSQAQADARIAEILAGIAPQGA